MEVPILDKGIDDWGNEEQEEAYDKLQQLKQDFEGSPTKLYINNNEELKDNSNIDNIPITYGGPVDTKKGFILHTSEFKDETTIKINSEIFLTSNVNILKSIVKGNGPKKSLFALGYAGWFAGQLEEELLNYGWLVAPGNSKLIFECKAEKKWSEAIKSIGINPNFLSSVHGKC